METAVTPRSPKRHLVRLRCFWLVAVPVLIVWWWVSFAVIFNVRITTRTDVCRNNMRQLAFGIDIALASRGDLPAFTVDADGKPLHSWRTLILPYIEHSVLYEKIRLDEPWDSEYNQQFHDVVIRAYHCRGDQDNFERPITNYFLVTGLGTLFLDSTPVSWDDYFSEQKKESNTLLLIESSNAVHWMCPEDISLAEYRAEAVPPAALRHRNEAYSDMSVKTLFEPPYLSYFSPAEQCFGYYLPLALFLSLPLVTVVSVTRFFYESIRQSNRTPEPR